MAGVPRDPAASSPRPRLAALVARAAVDGPTVTVGPVDPADVAWLELDRLEAPAPTSGAAAVVVQRWDARDPEGSRAQLAAAFAALAPGGVHAILVGDAGRDAVLALTRRAVLCLAEVPGSVTLVLVDGDLVVLERGDGAVDHVADALVAPLSLLSEGLLDAVSGGGR